MSNIQVTNAVPRIAGSFGHNIFTCTSHAMKIQSPTQISEEFKSTLMEVPKKGFENP